MTDQLPSPASSEGRALGDARPYEDLRAALAEEKIENGKLENKITELEFKLGLLERQVRDLEAEPWGKKKVRQLRQRKRAREEAKAQKALERGEERAAKRTAREQETGGVVAGAGETARRRTSAELTNTAAIEVGFVTEVPNYSAETDGPLERLDLSGLPVEQQASLNERIGLSAVIGDSAGPAVKDDGLVSQAGQDVEMVYDEDEAEVPATDDEIDSYDPYADDQKTITANGADPVSSIEQQASPVVSTLTTEEVPGGGGLRAKWTNGMLEMDRLQEAERANRSGNPSPLTAMIPFLGKPFQAAVSDALESPVMKNESPVSPVSLRGGAGEPPKKKKKLPNKAAEAIQKLWEDVASNSLGTRRLHFPATKIQIDELELGPYSRVLGKATAQAQNEQEADDDGSAELEAAGVTILGENTAREEPPKPSLQKPVLRFPAIPESAAWREEVQSPKNRRHQLSPVTAKAYKGYQVQHAVLAVENPHENWVPLSEAMAGLLGAKVEAANAISGESGKMCIAKAAAEAIARNAAEDETPIEQQAELGWPTSDSEFWRDIPGPGSPGSPSNSKKLAKHIKPAEHSGWSKTPTQFISFQEALEKEKKKVEVLKKDPEYNASSYPLDFPRVRSSPPSPLSPLKMKPTSTKKSSVRDRPPTPGLRRTKRTPPLNPRALFDYGSKATDEQYTLKIRSPKTIKRGKHVMFNLPEDSDEIVDVDTELQGYMASQADV